MEGCLHLPDTGREVDLLEDSQLRDELFGLDVGVCPSVGRWVHPW